MSIRSNRLQEVMKSLELVGRLPIKNYTAETYYIRRLHTSSRILEPETIVKYPTFQLGYYAGIIGNDTLVLYSGHNNEATHIYVPVVHDVYSGYIVRKEAVREK